MTLDFKHIKTAVAKQFARSVGNQLFTTDIPKDKLWETYLAAFPTGTDPMYKKRTEHDCGCCRAFVKTLGGVVWVVDGELVSIWDAQIGGAYGEVCYDMSLLVRLAGNIDNVFLHCEPHVGTNISRQLIEDAVQRNSVKTWEHFYVNLPVQCVAAKATIPSTLGITRETHDMLLRALETLSIDAVDTVLELIAQGSLYRGEEHSYVLNEFRKLLTGFNKLLTTRAKDRFVWSNISVPASISRIRNTVIGSLLVDLSDGVELESAVASFESKVAPTNYKRPTALVTKGMIQAAQQKVQELGLLSALQRRFATIDDLTVNNVLYVDRSSRVSYTRGVENSVFDDMTNIVINKHPKTTSHVEEVTIDSFLSNILPTCSSVELLVENQHAGNFVSLIAPSDPTAPTMFKWGNQFSWSYAGELADSIKQRVKRAGGAVEGDLCCRLAWEYTDDLDFHMMEPNGSRPYEIYYPNRRVASPNGGVLDVDANGADGRVEHPVENIVYANSKHMRVGVYELRVHNYSRNSDGRGFEVEIEFGGQTFSIAYDKALRGGELITVAKIQRDTNGQFSIIESLPSSVTSKTIWSLPTMTYHKVNAVMLSPNYWGDNPTGNKHYFFMLNGCKHDGRAWGFYNEFLTNDLTPHRKVLEIAGGKLGVEDVDAPLCGLGFSSTLRGSVMARVKGSFTRVVKVGF